MTKFTIPHDKAWTRPDKAYFEAQSQAKGIGTSEFDWNGKYKNIRELRDIAIFGLCLYELYKTSFFVQMNSKDSSPDAFVMRVSPTNSTINEISPVEITFYGRSRIGLPKQSLVDILSRIGGKSWKLPPRYCLLVHIGKDLQVDHEEVAAYLGKTKTNFQVFSIQEVAKYPDTIVQIVSYRPEFGSKNVNVAEVCYKLQKADVPGVVTQVRGKLSK